MRTNQPKGEDHYQCREVKAERDELRARNAELEHAINRVLDLMGERHDSRSEITEIMELALARTDTEDGHDTD